jgi:type I restriction enzyme R subunit
MLSPNSTEAETRRSLIDKALRHAGWDPDNRLLVGQEIPVDGFDPSAWQKLEQKLAKLKQQGIAYTGQLPKGISDYALFHPNSEVLSVVEAKRTSVDPRIAQVQTQFYAEEIAKRQSFQPFAFLTNGIDIYFWDVGRANMRLVSGFFTQQDLLGRLHRRTYGQSLKSMGINTAITERDYQTEALRRVATAFDAGKQRVLLVMATGTGKTRVAMSLIDMFLRSQQAERILFVADRDALVRQAMVEGFQEFLPDEPCARIGTSEDTRSQRLYAATLQTLSNIYQTFSPAFFDLIIFDEVHRSIFNKWNEVLQYFDARLVGLTATPADFLDRNTFLQFDCPDETPTYLYTYTDAIRDGHLVDYTLYIAQTKFQRKGIRGVDLSEEERNLLIARGLDPDDIDYTGTDLEKTVTNKDTMRKQWEEFMEVCIRDQSGMLPGKSIVFAITQEHAFRLQEVFEEMYPHYVDLVRVITHQSSYKGRSVEAFKKENMPRIAISVDMLDTGVNVPEIVNLAFMKPIQSRIKLEQMIGRGTRNHAACKRLDWLPTDKKEGFLVIDFWENDFSRSADKDIAQSLPVLVTLFNTRLSLLEHHLGNLHGEEAQRLIRELRSQVALIPTDSFIVKRSLLEIQDAWTELFWAYLTQDKIDFLRNKVGPLLRLAVAQDVAAATFTGKVARLRLQQLNRADTSATTASIAEDVSRLPPFVFEQPATEAAARLCLSGALSQATPAELAAIIDMLAPHMHSRKERLNNLLVLDLADTVETRGYIILTKRQEKVYVQEYRRRVEERVLQLVAAHPTIAALERGRAVSDAELLDLERTLREELSDATIELSEGNIRKAYALKVDSLLAFVRYLLEIEGLPDYREIVERQFADYMAVNPFNADQVRFLSAVKNTLLQRKRLHLYDLYEPPFDSFGDEAVERLWSEAQRAALLALVQKLAIA